MAVKKLQLWALISVCMAITVLGLLGTLVVAGGRTASAALGPTTLSGVPNVINYQGMLRQPDGTPINGTYTMTFRLYNDPVVASALYTETLQNIMVREGMFTVLLGDTDPIDTALFKLPLYVGIQVENDAEMAPRQRLAPVPYAVQLTDGIYVDGDGNVGVGTTSPGARLDVSGDAAVSGNAAVSSNVTVTGNTYIAGDVLMPAGGQDKKPIILDYIDPVGNPTQTGYSTSEYVCGIVGMGFWAGDIDEYYRDNYLLDARLVRESGQWVLYQDFRSEPNEDEARTAYILCVDVQLAEVTGNVP